MQNAPPMGAFCNILTFIKLSFVIKIFILSIFEWPFYTGFTVCIWAQHDEDSFVFYSLKITQHVLIRA